MEISKKDATRYKRKYSAKEMQQRRRASDAGAVIGGIAGAGMGYDSVKGAKRVGRSLEQGQQAYKTHRTAVKIPGSPETIGGHSRTKSLGAAAKTTVGAARRLPKSRAGLAELGGVYAGGVGGLIVGSAAGDRHALKRLNPKEPVGKSSRLMSDAEIRRRKKVQGHVSQATGALGLTALGGTLAASPAGRNALRKIPKLQEKVAAPKKKDPDRDRIKAATVPVLATSAGLGGASSFNFAAYTGAESRKRPVRKNWSATAGSYSPERNRRRRNDAYPGLAAGASGGAAAAAGIKTSQGMRLKAQAPGATAAGNRAGKAASRVEAVGNKAKQQKKAYAPTLAGAKKLQAKSEGLHDTARKLTEAGNKKFKTAGKLGAAGAGLAAGSMALERKRKSESWNVYKGMASEGVFGEIGKSADFLDQMPVDDD